MYLYLVLARRPLTDMAAAVELFKECYSAEARGIGYNLGLVYATNRKVSREDQDTLGIVEWR